MKILVDVLPGDARCNDLSDLAVVFPAYKEEKNLAQAVEAARSVGVGHVIIVNDCSPDRTGQIADELAAKHANVEVLHHEVNQGKQAAVKHGMARALEHNNVQKVATLDADMQDDPALLPIVAAPIGKYDMTNALRNKDQMPRQRRIANSLANGTYHIIAHININDIQAGYRVYTREVAQFLAQNLEDEGGYALEHTTMLAFGSMALQTGRDFRIAEIRTPYSYVEAESSIKARDILELSKMSIKVALELRKMLKGT